MSNSTSHRFTLKEVVKQMLESKFQANLIKKLHDRFPGCVVLKNDPNYIQGFPDLTILYEDKWAVLEVKQSAKASKRPNQSYYVDKLGEMSYSSFVYPENEEEVLNDIQRAFRPEGHTCLDGGE